MKNQIIAAEAERLCAGGLWNQWTDFMDTYVHFTRSNSPFHSNLHCQRVLLYALLIGMHKDLPDGAMTVLAQASVFHDSRRINDLQDQGHGARAGQYYHEFCSQHPDLITFDRRTELIMTFHDRNDVEGIAVFRSFVKELPLGALLYQIFKDADALDRFRLNDDALDQSFLRTHESLDLIDFAKDLVHRTAPTVQT